MGRQVFGTRMVYRETFLQIQRRLLQHLIRRASLAQTFFFVSVEAEATSNREMLCWNWRGSGPADVPRSTLQIRTYNPAAGMPTGWNFTHPSDEPCDLPDQYQTRDANIAGRSSLKLELETQSWISFGRGAKTDSISVFSAGHFHSPAPPPVSNLNLEAWKITLRFVLKHCSKSQSLTPPFLNQSLPLFFSSHFSPLFALTFLHMFNQSVSLFSISHFSPSFSITRCSPFFNRSLSHFFQSVCPPFVNQWVLFFSISQSLCLFWISQSSLFSISQSSLFSISHFSPQKKRENKKKTTESKKEKIQKNKNKQKAKQNEQKKKTKKKHFFKSKNIKL